MYKFFSQIEKFVKGLPIIKDIPGFSSLPDKITPHNLRFYKLSNLVHTLGMFVQELLTDLLNNSESIKVNGERVSKIVSLLENQVKNS